MYHLLYLPNIYASTNTTLKQAMPLAGWGIALKSICGSTSIGSLPSRSSENLAAVWAEVRLTPLAQIGFKLPILGTRPGGIFLSGQEKWFLTAERICDFLLGSSEPSTQLVSPASNLANKLFELADSITEIVRKFG